MSWNFREKNKEMKNMGPKLNDNWVLNQDIQNSLYKVLKQRPETRKDMEQ